MSILSQYNHILHNRESPPPFEQPRKTNDKCDVREEQIDLRDEPVTDHELPERPIRVAVDFNAANDDTVIVDWPKEVRKLGGAPRKEMSTATRHLSDIPGSAEEESDSNENNSAQQVSVHFFGTHLRASFTCIRIGEITKKLESMTMTIHSSMMRRTFLWNSFYIDQR